MYSTDTHTHTPAVGDGGGIWVTPPSQGPHVVQHGEYTGGALWYSKVRPAEVAQVVDGVGDTDLALGRGGAVIVGGMRRPCVMQSWQGPIKHSFRN